MADAEVGDEAMRAGGRRLFVAAAWALALVPGLWLALDGLRAATDAYTPVPFWDHWATVADYLRAKRDGLSWQILFAQSNEHRILFPRLLMFADLEFFKGRSGLLYGGILACQAALLALFGVVAARLRTNRTPALAALGVAAALVFSLGQWENLIWAFQVTFLMVAAAGAWSAYLFCLALAQRERPSAALWGGSAVLLVVSAFSMANGMVAGGACIGVGLLARLPWRWLLAHAVLVAVVAALYFHGYQSAPDASFAGPLRDPAGFVRFVAIYLGNPARAWGLSLAPWLGALGLALSMAAALRVLLGRDRDAGRLALVTLMAFVVGSAAITAAGRMAHGVEQGLVSRYLTFGLMFWAAQLVYWASLLPVRGPRTLLAWAAALAVLAYPLGVLQARAEPEVAARAARIRTGVIALWAGADDPQALGGVNWNVPAMMEQVAALKARRLSIFADRPRFETGAVLPAGEVRPNGCVAAFDMIQKAPEGSGWRASGWAWDVAAGAPVEAVVLVDAAGRVVTVGASGGWRADVPPVVPQVGSDYSGWNASIAAGPSFPVQAFGLLKDGGRCDLGAKPQPG
ncbi:hypothetical protein [Phenylobacterium sp.]|jgi:hypothetical protein|uniref:hypothetical protein n=1 Tax=Phenylobacterium sp. TaxID=1871053 RepID=UPI002F95F020